MSHHILFNMHRKLGTKSIQQWKLADDLKIMKWGTLQKTAEVILQKPGTGTEKQLKFSMPSGVSCELFG